MKQNIGKSLRAIRKEHNLTQIQLGKKIGINSALISQYENETTKPSTTTLEKFSRFYKMPIAFILIYGLDEKSFPRKYQSKFKVIHQPILNIIKEIYK